MAQKKKPALQPLNFDQWWAEDGYVRQPSAFEMAGMRRAWNVALDQAVACLPAGEEIETAKKITGLKVKQW